MAVLKHIASKNADYGEALNYLLFQHNEENGKPILDEMGRMVLRTQMNIFRKTRDSTKSNLITTSSASIQGMSKIMVLLEK